MKTTIKNINTNIKLNNLLKVMGLSVILLGILGSLVSCGGAEAEATTSSEIRGEATFGGQTTTDVSTDSFMDIQDGNTYYFIRVDGLTNELDSSGADGSLTITEYSGGESIAGLGTSFSDALGYGPDIMQLDGRGFTDRAGVNYPIFIFFEGQPVSNLIDLNSFTITAPAGLAVNTTSTTLNGTNLNITLTGTLTADSEVGITVSGPSSSVLTANGYSWYSADGTARDEYKHTLLSSDAGQNVIGPDLIIFGYDTDFTDFNEFTAADNVANNNIVRYKVTFTY